VLKIAIHGLVELMPKVPGYDDFEFVLHQFEGTYNITELSTGATICKALAEPIARKMFTQRITSQPLDSFIPRLENMKKIIAVNGIDYPVNDVEKVVELVLNHGKKSNQ
jgi:hypothetical protein